MNGLLLINKPEGITSHDLVDWARKIFKTRAVGHCGTLDPMASGLMVLLLNEATKLSQYILEKDKVYRLKAEFGWTTDTLDKTGRELTRVSVHLKPDEIKAKILALQGELDLQVPMYSAIKVDGQRLHEVARAQNAVDIAPVRKMTFFDLKVLEVSEHSCELEMHCSKGSYVRSWVRALGESLGPGATLTSLVRLGSWPYSLQQAVNVGEVESWLTQGKNLQDLLIPMHLALPDYKTVRVQGTDRTLALNGQISHGLKSQLISLFNPDLDRGVKLIEGGDAKLLALVGVDPGKGFVFRRVFRD